MIYECTENVHLKSIARRAWKKGFDHFALIAHVDRWRRPLVWRLLPQFCLHLWQYCLTPWQLQTMLLMLIIKRVEVDSIDGISVIYHRICFPLRFPACGNMYIKNLWNNIVLQACVFMKSVEWMSRICWPLRRCCCTLCGFRGGPHCCLRRGGFFVRAGDGCCSTCLCQCQRV